MKITFYIDSEYVGTGKETVDFPDDTTVEEISDRFEIWLSKHLEAGWYREENDD